MHVHTDSIALCHSKRATKSSAIFHVSDRCLIYVHSRRTWVSKKTWRHLDIVKQKGYAPCFLQNKNTHTAMNPSCVLSYGTGCICVLQWLSWMRSLHCHSLHLLAAVPCEGVVDGLVECGGLWMLFLLFFFFFFFFFLFLFFLSFSFPTIL